MKNSELSREDAIKKAEACRDEIRAVLKKYGAELIYDMNSPYSEDHGGVTLKGRDDIPDAELEINLSDWSF